MVDGHGDNSELSEISDFDNLKSCQNFENVSNEKFLVLSQHRFCNVHKTIRLRIFSQNVRAISLYAIS